MIKKNKGTLIFTSIILLLPMAIGLLLWDKLPEQVPMHWNAVGEVDGWGSKSMLVFVMPLFLLGLHWLGVLVTSFDKKSAVINGKPLQLALWVCPFISLLVHALVYTTILGYDLTVEIIMPLAMGLMFMVIGNLLPKCKRNRSIGIKVPWALADDENWNKTHRFAGKVWVLGGAVMMASAVLGSIVLFFVISLLMCIVPTLYSYLFYRKNKKNYDVD